MMVLARIDFHFLNIEQHSALKYLRDEKEYRLFVMKLVVFTSISYREMIDCNFQDQRISSLVAKMLILDS